MHRDHLAGRLDAQAVARRGRGGGKTFPHRGLVADEHDPGVERLLEKLQRSGDRHGRAVIASHRVDGNGDLHQPAGFLGVGIGKPNAEEGACARYVASAGSGVSEAT